MRLSELKRKQTATITQVYATQSVASSGLDPIRLRLESLGFVAGTEVQVITKGFFGGDPILVQLGFTRFALRKSEAARIEVQLNVQTEAITGEQNNDTSASVQEHAE